MQKYRKCYINLMENILSEDSRIPRPGKYISYGTAGFRTKATDLPLVFFRSGLVALLRASETENSIGIMVTASHNEIQDNGLKMVDYNGEMLPISWEKTAEDLANTQDLQQTLSGLVSKPLSGKILIGADNRPSSPELVAYIKSAITAAGCSYYDYGLLTTPQLHFLTKHSNEAQEEIQPSFYTNSIKEKADFLFAKFTGGNRYEPYLDLDCAGGVGSGVMIELAYDWIKLYNTSPEILNSECGAEYAHKKRKLPRSLEIGRKCASFDGDADRLVYYTSSQELEVLGGERLTVLYAAALNQLMKTENVNATITVVTTGYSNSASINYLKDQGISCVIVPTGVKYLHEEAHKHDISIYFESNGHGTVLHKPSVIEEFKRLGAQYSASFLQLANETVGDAVADLLLAEVSLRILDWNLADWLSLYQDLPNIMEAKITPLKDSIKNSWDQLEILEPKEFSNQVKAIISNFSEYQARTLIRPSGTEPIVRIYVEANSLEICKAISEEIIKLL